MAGTEQVAEQRERVVVRFAGDSGDGMQLAGARFTDATAALGNDLATLPDFPAEIRAPQGTLAGVSAFQVHFADRDILTPGDAPDVLVAMNPAALRANVATLPAGATIIVNEDAFTVRAVQKAGYQSSPLDDDSLSAFVVRRIPMGTMLTRAAETIDGASSRDAARAGNIFALGVVSWLYDRPREPVESWITAKFKGKPAVQAMNLAAFKAGWSFGETSELMGGQIHVAPRTDVPPGRYRNVDGSTATALGLVSAATKAGLPVVYSSYPITPASELLHQLAAMQLAGLQTIQAEDEIAAASMALGASFAGSLGITATSGPGMDLKAETIGLAVMLELPLVVIDVQRAGPSTGMPTKPEQSDLMLALHGRHGESPVPVVAASTPGTCFDMAVEAVRIAVTHRTPVILLSDAFLANSSEPWRIPTLEGLPEIDPDFQLERPEGFSPYMRDELLRRPWIKPGTPDLQHRIGGIEKDPSGAISYDGANHEAMTALRSARLEAIDVPPIEVDADEGATVLVLGWGSTYGAIRAGVRRVRDRGLPIACAHVHHLHPLPPNLDEVVHGYETVIVPELNSGQFADLVRARTLKDVRAVACLEGRPFRAAEMEETLMEHLR